MDYTRKLTDTDVMQEACDALNIHVPLEAEGYVCTGTDLWQIMLGASVKQMTIHGLCESLENAPSDGAVRGYLNAQLRVENLPEIEDRMNAVLAAQIPRRVFNRGRDTAMDFHEQAYYGKAKQTPGLWIRAEAKNGTTRFYRVATAYVIWRDQRVTLGIKFVTPNDDTVGILSDLLKRLKGLKYCIKTLFLDRGFDGVRVMRFLTKTRLRAVIACTIRGKTGGTRALCRGRGSYLTRYTFNSPEQGHFTANLAVCKVFTTARRTGRQPRRADWMIFILIRCAFSPQQVRQAYRRRFGIESSYRCARHTRAWTTSPNPALRFVLIALSFFLVNVWVALRWRFAQIPRQGGRLVDYAHFRLQRLIDWIARVVDRIYRPVSAIHALAIPIL
jgi:IS4 transposase